MTLPKHRGRMEEGIIQALEVPVEALHLVRLQHIDPLLDALSSVLYDYTIPQLTDRAVTAMQRRSGESQPIYSGRKGAAIRNETPEETYAVPLEAVRLISGMYSHFLDPLRFAGVDAPLPERTEIVHDFARSLVGSRLLPSVEMVAANMPLLRALDTFQDGLGTNVMRWMQYLAFEAMDANGPRRASATGRELDRLRIALSLIRDSSTIQDRFKALGRPAR